MSKIRKTRTLPVTAVLGALTCWSLIASADPITIEFEVSGFAEGAELSGSFTGEDSNNSGSLAHGIFGVFELTAFSLEWSGNSITAAFTQGLSDLRTLIYDIGGNTLLEFRSTQGGGFFSTPAAFGSPLFADVNGPEFLFSSVQTQTTRQSDSQA